MTCLTALRCSSGGTMRVVPVVGVRCLVSSLETTDRKSRLALLGALRVKLAAVGLSAQEEWHIYVSCLCMEGFMVRKHTSNATNSRDHAQLPVRSRSL